MLFFKLLLKNKIKKRQTFFSKAKRRMAIYMLIARCFLGSYSYILQSNHTMQGRWFSHSVVKNRKSANKKLKCRLQTGTCYCALRSLSNVSAGIAFVLSISFTEERPIVVTEEKLTA